MQFFCTCICICNILQLLRGCRTHWCCVRLTVTLCIMFTIVIVFTTCRFDEKLPLVLQSAAILIKFLYNMVLDTFDRYKYMNIVVYFYEKKTQQSVKIVKCIIVFHNILNEIYSDLFLWWYLKTKMEILACTDLHIRNEVNCRFILCGFRPSACLQVQTDSPALKRFTMVQEEEKSRSLSLKRASTGSITFSVNIQCDLIIVHPGAVMSILHLLPAAELEGQLIVSMDQRCTKKNDV